MPDQVGCLHLGHTWPGVISQECTEFHKGLTWNGDSTGLDFSKGHAAVWRRTQKKTRCKSGKSR